MCLTGVDYFSTLGYQPSIAFDATGRLAPLATVVLVLVTLGCALPVYCHVASRSPHGQGSISMLENLVAGWPGKFLVLVLLGFAATDYVITKTLSAADAAEHLIHNPLWEETPQWLQGQMVVTMLLLVMLGALFLRGFREVIASAVVLVGVYLFLNVVVVGCGLWHLMTHGTKLVDWYQAVQAGDWALAEAPVHGHGWGAVIVVCLLYFPKLALGLSGFETGVAVMPLVQGHADDDPLHPAGRIRNARKLLITAALIMSFLLLASSLVTSTLIDPEAFHISGQAKNRALAYIAHAETAEPINPLFGEVFGTLYDVSTVTILWFAGASAMSGLLNLVPRYLPRFGMAPQWAEAIRPLVILFTGINLFVTWVFEADAEKQGAAYATGVLVLMTSAAIAVVIDRWRTNLGSGLARVPWLYVLITAIFAYTTVANVLEKPDGIKIAGAFVVGVLVFSMVSRARRSTELRFERFEFADTHSRFLWDALRHLEFPILVPHRPGHHDIKAKDEQIRRVHRLGNEVPIVFVEATLGDTSEFEQSPLIEIVEQEGRFILRLTRCVSIAHALASVALELSKSGQPPELHFGWSDESPFWANLSFVLFGEGNVPWLVRELISKAQPDPRLRPRVVVG